MKITAAPTYEGFPHFNQDLAVPADVMVLADAVRAADGIIIVSPEYGWTIPGALKNALDWVSKTKDQPFKDKPVALQSASTGPLGASRMQYHLRQTLASIDAHGLDQAGSATRFRQGQVRCRHGCAERSALRSIW